MASATAWRTTLALAVSWLTVIASSGGLFVFAPAAQVGVGAGVVAGLIAPTLLTSALAAGVAGLLGSFAGPANAWFGSAAAGAAMGAAVTSAAVGAAIAVATRFAMTKQSVSPRRIVWIAFAIVVVNMWVTTLSANSESAFYPIAATAMPSFDEQLDDRIPDAIAAGDDAWFYLIYNQVRAGTSYYGAFHNAPIDNPQWGRPR